MKRKLIWIIPVVLVILTLNEVLTAPPEDEIGWYIVPYERDRRLGSPQPARHCALCKYNKQIWDAGGKWTCVEVLGNRAIVKMKAPVAIHELVAGLYKKLPKDRLDGSLSDLPAAAKTALKNEILDMGYTPEEVLTKFGNDLGQYPLRDVLKFMAKRKRAPRYVTPSDDFVCDGDIEELTGSIEYIDNKVK